MLIRKDTYAVCLLERLDLTLKSAASWPEASSTSSLREPPRAGSPPRDEASHPVLGPWVSQAPLTASSSGVGLTAPVPAAHRCRRLWEVRLLFWLSDTTPRATSPGQGQPDSPQVLDTAC